VYKAGAGAERVLACPEVLRAAYNPGVRKILLLKKFGMWGQSNTQSCCRKIRTIVAKA